MPHRQWQTVVMKQWGDIVPTARCYYHAKILNLSYGGKVYLTPKGVRWGGIGPREDYVSSGSSFPSVPAGSIIRTLPVVYTIGTTMPVRLIASPGAGGQILATETVPTGLTPVLVPPTPGTATVAGQSITWTVMPGTTVPEVLNYTVTPTAGPTLTFTGTYDTGPSWPGQTIGGDAHAYAPNPLGVFTWHGDIGIEPVVGAPTGDPSIPGAATFAGTQYTVSGAGSDVWDAVDRCHLVARGQVGNFYMEGTVGWQDTGPSPWSKAGLMVRRGIDGPSAMAFVGIRNPANVPGRDVIFQWRDSDGAMANSAGDASAVFRTAPVRLRLVRCGNMVSGFVTSGTAWVSAGTRSVPALTAEEVVAALFVTSHTDDGFGAPPAGTAVLATATFDNVLIGNLALKAATRDIQATTYSLTRPTHVVIDLVHAANSTPLAVRETVPTGWSASAISHGGTQAGNVITWTLASFTASVQLSYDILPPTDSVQPGQFSGFATDQSGIDTPITGDSVIRSGEAKRGI
jgi:hypothetical protein